MLEFDATGGAACTTLAIRNGRLVVRKVRPPHPVSRVEGEARWLAAVRHHGIVGLARVSLAEGLIETEFAGSATLRTARLSPVQRALVLVQVAEILSDCHQRGFVHGSIKPEHVILCPGTITPVLCSPHYSDNDPSADISGLADLVDHGLRCGTGRHASAWLETKVRLINNRHRIRISTSVDWLSKLTKSSRLDLPKPHLSWRKAA